MLIIFINLLFQVKGESQQANLTFFNWYYWCVNVGTLVALLVITYVQQHDSFYDGYLSALICLGVAAVVFLCGNYNTILLELNTSKFTCCRFNHLIYILGNQLL